MPRKAGFRKGNSRGGQNIPGVFIVAPIPQLKGEAGSPFMSPWDPAATEVVEIGNGRMPLASGKLIVVGAEIRRVVAVANFGGGIKRADKIVIAGAAEKSIRALSAVDVVFAAFAFEIVPAGVAEKDVVAVAAEDFVVVQSAG